MTVKAPSAQQLRAAASRLGLSLDDRDIEEFRQLIIDAMPFYRPLDGMSDVTPPVKYPRTPGRRPDADEDPLHAWYVKTSVRGAEEGPLAGRQVVLKDTVFLAGVPLMNGASTMVGFTPDFDATVVTRILDAGGEIVGKANCEYFCFSGGSHTNATGPTRNPHGHDHTSGGSSSGCAAIVGSGEVAMAIGGDQGGSIREPSSFCGIYGMKATHGLVPYTGIFPVDHTLDHAGPMTGTVADNALLLEVIAGEDGLDPRQYAPQLHRYTDHLDRGVEGLRIGVVQEGFAHAHSDPAVDAAVRQAAERFAALGAEVDEVSVPLHRQGMSVWAPIAIEGTTRLVLRDNAMGTGWRGQYPTAMGAVHAGWRRNADQFSEIMKLGALMGEYMLHEYDGHYYAKAQNLSRRLRAAYDEALDRFDLLLMPTTPTTAPPLPAPGCSREEDMSPGFDPITNTAPFNCTGHPAMSLPCGTSEGLPIGVMLIARHWDEPTIYRAARAHEQTFGQAEVS